MMPPVFALYLSFLFLGETARATALKFSSSVPQNNDFVSVKTGDSLTLQCFYEGKIAGRLYWFKQTPGYKPRLISTFYRYERNCTFYNEFNNNPRFTLDTENTKNHLTITDINISDSANYFCISCCLHSLEISESVTVSVEGSGSNIPALVQQSASETVQPGGSVTLNCTVHTGSCDGEHSVYWFKNSQESHPGLIYTHGGRNDQCEREANTQTHSCVYNLPLKSLNVSHAGTYYCAVASCGHILFGNGTTLDFKDEYFSSGPLIFTVILLVLVAFLVCMMRKTNYCRSSESQAKCSALSTANKEDYKNADTLYYAALSVTLSKRSRSQRDQTWSECVYYSVRQ